MPLVGGDQDVTSPSAYSGNQMKPISTITCPDTNDDDDRVSATRMPNFRHGVTSTPH